MYLQNLVIIQKLYILSNWHQGFIDWEERNWNPVQDVFVAVEALEVLGKVTLNQIGLLLLYVHHYKLLLIKNHSWTLTMQKAMILKVFCFINGWTKSGLKIQTTDYNGTNRVIDSRVWPVLCIEKVDTIMMYVVFYF